MTAPDCCRILSPTAILGYGFPESSFERGLTYDPDVIAVDAGSVDPGPYYLGAGVSFTDRAGVKRDLRVILRAAVPRGIPVIVGSCGGAGAAPHLAWARAIVDELLDELALDARVAAIHADVPAQAVLDAVDAGRTRPLTGVPALTRATVEGSLNIVAQMGVGPFQQALEAEPDIVLAGRAYDPSVFAAWPIKHGYDPGLAIHLGKILECAAIAADPGSGADCVLGVLHRDSFELVPLSDDRRFTPESVAAHSLYEKSDPYSLPGPGGHLDLRQVTFEAVDDRRVRVRGSRFVPADEHLIKIEGARLAGYRTICVAGLRDPTMIRQIDEILAYIRGQAEGMLAQERLQGQLHFHVYGRDGVMQSWEPQAGVTAHELGLVIEAVAPTQDAANSLCSMTRSTLLHYGYPGRIATAGNLAFPFSPSDLKAGPVYEFSIYHLMAVDDESMFRVEVT